MRQTLTERF